MMTQEELEIPPTYQREAFERAHAELIQWQREVTCAQHLAEKLQPFVNGEMDEAAFRAFATKLGQELATTAMGGSLLRCIGYAYKRQGQLALGVSNVAGGVGERMKGAEAYWRSTGHTLNNYAKMASAGFSTYSSVSALQSHEQENPPPHPPPHAACK